MSTSLASKARIIIFPPIDLGGEIRNSTIKNGERINIDCWKNPVLAKTCSILIREGVHEIIVPDLGLYNLEDIPKGLQSRIRMVDKRKSQLKNIQTFFQPIIDDFPVNQKNLKELNILNLIAYSLYSLSLASKENALSGKPLPSINDIHSLKKVLKCEEAINRLDLIEGITNAYHKGTADIIEPISTSISISERLIDILEDAEIQHLQESRYLLGVPGKVKEGLVKTKRWVKRISINPDYKNIVKASAETIKFSSTLNNIILPGVPQFSPKQYSPPIVDLNWAYQQAQGTPITFSLSLLDRGSFELIETIGDLKHNRLGN